jgi:uncharacterized membrane protein YfcA
MTVALVGLAALAAASVQATIGIGFALVLTPVMFAVLTPTGAIVTVTALGLELNLLVLLAERRRPRVAWRELVPILVAAVPGTVSGVLILHALSKPVLQVAVGVALIAAALALGRRVAAPVASGSSSAGTQLAVGFTTGVLTTSTGVSGPPLALWFSRGVLTPGEVRDSLSALFLVIGVVGFLSLVPVLGGAHLDTGLIAAGLACVIAGHALGRRAFARLEPARFRPLLLLVILAAGVASVVAGIGSL